MSTKKNKKSCGGGRTMAKISYEAKVSSQSLDTFFTDSKDDSE